MPKPYTFPTIYDDCLTINISDLKKWGYFEPNHYKSGVLSWSRNGEVHSKISIAISMGDSPYMELDYTCNDEPRKYKVYFETVPSNLGKGEIYYFLCPFTKLRCRKLYLIGGYFCHRSKAPNGLYDTQVRSKHYRSMEKLYGAYFSLDRLYEQLYSKHFRKYYAGKPTKRYLKLKRQIEKGEAIPYHEIEKAMVK